MLKLFYNAEYAVSNKKSWKKAHRVVGKEKLKLLMIKTGINNTLLHLVIEAVIFLIVNFIFFHLGSKTFRRIRLIIF